MLTNARFYSSERVLLQDLAYTVAVGKMGCEVYQTIEHTTQMRHVGLQNAYKYWMLKIKNRC